jgi:hypothetical protein
MPLQGAPHCPMKPKFTDQHKYPRGYTRSESTDVAKTWAAARARLVYGTGHPESNVRMLNRLAAV